jgi:LmbE family N-acetylglucosaminyl deacetylase
MVRTTVIELAPRSFGSVLCLGAHSDDIEIGCGGTILRWTRENPGLKFHWVVFSAPGERRSEAEKSALGFLESCEEKQIDLHAFRDGFFPSHFAEIKQTFEELKAVVAPDVILTHYGSDRHQDHRVVSELTWNTFRNHLVLEYEIPKYDGDLGQPNVFVAMDDEVCERKIDLLYEHFPTQAGRTWFERDTFRGLMRLRGVECAAPGRFAEAFYGKKLRIT